MANITDNQTIEGLVDTKSIRTQAAVQATAAVTTTLTAASEYVWLFTGTTAGQIIALTSATTISIGHRYEIHNNSSQPITVNDNAGGLLSTILQNQRGVFVLQVAGTAAGTWSTIKDDSGSASNTGIRAHEMFEEFFIPSLSDQDFFHFLDFAANGGTAVIESGAPTDNSYLGSCNVTTGTTSNATGVGGFESSTGDNRIKAGGGEFTLEFRCRVPVLSGTPVYNIKLGLMDSNTIGTPTNGIFFTYTNGTNSGNWQAICRNASTSTTINSTTAVVANAWTKLEIQINTAGTLVTYLINGISVGTSTTNIPTTNAMRIMFRIEKQGSSTTTSRTLMTDSVYYRMERP